MNKKALLIIDVQNGYINEHTKNIPKDVEQLQGDYEYIWAAKLVYTDDSPFINIRNLNGFENIENPTELAFQPSNKVKLIVKHGYSAATPGLIKALSEDNISQVYLAGVDTDQCVLATALTLFDLGIRPIILAQYCASTGGKEMHEAGLKVLSRAIGKHNVLHEDYNI